MPQVTLIRTYCGANGRLTSFYAKEGSFQALKDHVADIVCNMMPFNVLEGR